jgi:hypothetical protein
MVHANANSDQVLLNALVLGHGWMRFRGLTAITVFLLLLFLLFLFVSFVSFGSLALIALSFLSSGVVARC